MSEGFSRRSFLKIASAAGAAAAIPGCEPAGRELIPYVVPDENVIPGVPSFYATTCNECGAGCGVVARVREGRVIKLEGNPKDPIGQGSLCARGQAALQGLYNPDRLAHPFVRGDDGRVRRISWDIATRALLGHLSTAAKAGKDRVAYLAHPQGPTLAKIAGLWLSAWNSSKAVFYEPLASSVAQQAAQDCFGRSDTPVYHLDQAEALISFGADFIDTWGSPLELMRQYAAFRAPRQRRGKLAIGRAVYVGPRLNLTAAKSDEWIAVKPGHEAAIAMSVLYVLVRQGWISPNSGFDIATLKSFVAGYEPETVSQQTGVSAEAIMRLGQVFGQAEGAVALAGTEDKQAHVAAFVLNAVTGNLGKTVTFLDGAPASSLSSQADLDGLITAMNQKQVDVLVIAAGANPVYAMSPAAKFNDALRQVPFVVWGGLVPDETAERAHLLLPIHHPLESWRDSAPRAGINGLGQPVMQPVFESRDLGDVMLESARAASTDSKAVPWQSTAEAVKASFQDLQKQLGDQGKPEDFFAQALRDGGVFSAAKAADVKLKAAILQNKPKPPDAGPDLVLAVYPHIFLYDGRGANKSWLQEIPEPVDQLVWDSWAEIHPETAKTLGIAADEVVELKTDQGTVAVSALVSEHVRPGVIALPLGQGHTSYGRYAKGRGVNAFTILAPGALSAAVKVSGTGRKNPLVSPLYSEDMMGRNIVEAMSIEDLARGITPKSETETEPYEMYGAFKYPTHQWGMTIDVNACVGCSACVAACYAENNLAVVGKEGVHHGRIMSWMRIERYTPPKAEADKAPLMYITPMLCQQCEHAPCEPVCPVFAAYHTQEGINGQNYNRCIGTRYCENNCTYKVRRFNWYKPEWPAPLHLQLNPDVTVRGAGVMEKCTFCMQRIVYAEINAKTSDRALHDGEIVPACAQTCPTRAISFGDRNDKQSAMMQRRKDNDLRTYRILNAEFNTLPAITYLREIYHEKGRA
ncbi:MAG TPA: molybdopterin dinucleotide binding domain-containing protein [Candidatus Binataceae bacterium]|nr:molybdopterin dinucleotide binding domain-containing protein [Candidatus Binataceae bacterium]